MGQSYCIISILASFLLFDNGRQKGGICVMEEKPIHKSVGNTGKKQSVSGIDSTEVWCTVYKNRWGQIMEAAKYGYKAWHFPIGKR